MKTTIAAGCAFLLALICLLLWHQRPVGQRGRASDTTGPAALSRPDLPLRAHAAPGRGIPAGPAGPSAEAPKAEPSTQSNLIQRALDDWRTRIEFYGIAVDENTNPLPGAQVEFDCNDLSPSGTSYYHTQTDTNGLFSINGITGKLLAVKVHKEGYYPFLPFGTNFFYAGENENFVPDENNPIVFYLRKRGNGEALLAVKRNYGVPRDGTPVGIDLMAGNAVSGGTGDVVVQCWTEDQGKRAGERYDWHCRLTIPGGGLVPFEEHFPFTAPEDGYAPAAEISMPADRADWRAEADLTFFYRLADARYGRMRFSMVAGGHHFCMIDSFLNPSGSRNLEPMETKPQAPALPAWAPPGTRAVIPQFK